MAHETDDDPGALYRPLLAYVGGDELSALVERAGGHARRKEWYEAEACLLHVLRCVPAAGLARAYLGLLRLELGQVDAAVRLKQAEMLLRLGLRAQAQKELLRAARVRLHDAMTLERIHFLLTATRDAEPETVEKRSEAPTGFWRNLMAHFLSKDSASARMQVV